MPEYEYKRKTVTDFAHDFSCFNLWVKVSKEGGFDVDDIIQYHPKRTMVPSAEGSKRTCSIPRLQRDCQSRRGGELDGARGGKGAGTAGDESC